MRTLIWLSTAILSCGMAHATPSADHNTYEDLRGTWRVEVTTYNCKSGVQNPPFMSLLTFAEGGTLTGTTSNPVFQPGQRSSEMGYWKRRGADDFVSVTEAFIEFSTPAHGPVPPLARGVQRIEQTIDMGSKLDFTSEATLTFFDESGTVLSKACAKAKARLRETGRESSHSRPRRALPRLFFNWAEHTLRSEDPRCLDACENQALSDRRDKLVFS